MMKRYTARLLAGDSGNRFRLFVSILCGWVFGCGVTAAWAGTLKTHVYPVLFGDPQALETFAKAVVGEDGHVVLDARGSRLIVVTSEEKHAQLNQVMGQADWTRENVRIAVRFLESGSAQEWGGSVRIEGEIGPGGVVTVHPELRYGQQVYSALTVQTIMAGSGREGRLRIGERVPYIDWIMEYGWHGGYVEPRLQWQEVGSFLVVTPTILADGQTIHVRLTPELRGIVNGEPRQVRFSGLNTDVMVRDGVTVRIGGLTEDRDFYSRFLVGMDRSGARRSLDIELTPHIIGAGGNRGTGIRAF